MTLYRPLDTVAPGARRGRRASPPSASGYADGYFRALVNRSTCIIAGQPVPVIGRISMDLVTIDVTDVPEAASQPGASVEVLGAHLTPDDLAELARTNGYEIMTALGRRYHRAYVEGRRRAETLAKTRRRRA